MSHYCLSRFFWVVLTLTTVVQTTLAQDYQMSIEITNEHTGEVGEVDLSNHTTYRFYIETADPGDRVISIFGNQNAPTEIIASAGFFNSIYASGPSASGISLDGLATYPSLQFDSYVTIGIEHEPDLGSGESLIDVEEDMNQQWIPNLFNPSATSGESIYINSDNGGSWSVNENSTNAIAGEDLKVLIAQFTSTACLSGVLNALIQPADGSDSFVLAQQFNCTDCGPIGCSDPLACNYDPGAPAYPGSNANCTFAEDGFACDGNCLADADGDGICDAFEEAGCTDADALNFDPEATDDDGFCAYAEDFACTDEAACNYAPFSGPAYCLQIEPFIEHDGLVGTDDLTGYTTYRIYALCENTDDFVSSVSGDSEFPTRIMSTGDFFQSDFGGLLGSDQNPALFAFFPGAEYDSFVTIGLTESASNSNGEGTINVVDNAANPWGSNFENGNDLIIDDEIGGSWFIFNGNTNGTAGDDFRVLLAQVTTNGDLSGSMYVQFFENGNPVDEFRELIDFQQACYGPDVTFSCTYPGDVLDCDGNCLNDLDGDGVCDEDEVAGCTEILACNYDGNATDQDDSCTYAEDGYDCEGNCLSDADEDGVCDEFEVAGCTDAAACNYDASATDDNGACAYAQSGYDCQGDCLADADSDGICDAFEIAGCSDENACNFNAAATDDDGSCFAAEPGYDCDGNCLMDADGDGICDAFEINGCTDDAACNYDASATDEDGTCDFCSCSTSGLPIDETYTMTVETHAVDVVPGFTTYRFYINLLNEDDFLSSIYGNDEDEFYLNTPNGFWNSPLGAVVASEINPAFFVFFPEIGADSWVTIGIESQNVGAESAISSVESADQPWTGSFAAGTSNGQDIAMNDMAGGAWYVLNGTPNGLPDGNGRVLFMQITMDSNDGAPSGLINAQVFVNGTGSNDLRLTFDFDGSGEFTPDGFDPGTSENACGCTDPLAFNYDESAQYDDGSCIATLEGCLDESACNFNANANTDNGSCDFAETGYDCAGNCLNDGDGDGICDEFEVAGCTEAEACNFDAGATDNDDSCNYAESGYDCDGNCLIDADGDGVCDAFEVAGCQDSTACNFNAEATDSDDSCEYPNEGYDCGGNCLTDTDDDGVCDAFEVEGCQDAGACNYNPEATDADDSCVYAEEGYDCAGNCLTDTDGDGVCDAFEVQGCQDTAACNYNTEATDSDDSCEYAEEGYDCDGNCASDIDGDGICDPFEIGGCDDAQACNYDDNATDNDGSCDYGENGYDCEGNCISDADGDGICDEFEIAGCTDPAAANYDPLATEDDASCLDPVCIDPEACNYTATATGDYCLIVQPYQVHDGGELDGFVTYRIYIKTQSPDDFISSVSGDAESPTRIISSGSFFQSSFGGLLGSDQNPALWAFFPTAEYDSFVTVGLTQSPAAGEGTINVIESAGNTWGDNFENGQDLLIDDAIGGGWFIFNGNTNGIAGDDEQVLLAQVTTNGELSGSLYVQVFINGDPANDDRVLLDIEEACFAPGGPEVCEFPEEGYDCDGNCASDIDGDGICDPFEIGGCDDAQACNYDDNATDNDGSCDYGENGYDCEGNCISDADGDGICDEFEIAGCTDPAAANYDPLATEDDASCLDPVCIDPEACNYTATATGDYCLIVQPYQVHDGGELDGFVTYRIYIKTQSPDDFISSVSGDAESPTRIISSGSFFQSSFGGLLGSDQNPALWAFFPTAEYDSFVTVGLTQSPAAGEGTINVIESAGNTWGDNFENGQDLLIDDAIGGGWFIFNGNTNGIAGDDEQVLLAQVTTNGELSGSLYVQVFINGDPANDDRVLLDIEEACFAPGGPEVCEFPEEGYDCDGNCASDIDGDGICDPFEIGGCDDAQACNYDDNATDNDGSCDYGENGYDCEGNCISDADGDGICDEFEIAGCTDPAAANYDPLATEDDASCLDPVCIDPEACNYTATATGDYCLIVQPYQVHDGGELDGFVTYRIYIKTQSPDDFISSVSGDAESPTRIISSGSFFQSSFGGLLGSDQNPALWAFFPTAEYDSFVTVGLTQSPAAGEGTINVIESAGNTWGDNFENGQDLLIDDAIGGGWFIFNGNTNGIAGDDEQVLLAQVTTNGELSGSLYVQVFINGDPANDDRVLLDIEEACFAPGGPEVCEFPEEGYDCDGNCASDIDGDGICDPFEIGGCDDAQACNYDDNATDNDGSCDYGENGYDCEGNCISDADGDGICDEFEIAGCTDPAAANYDPLATEDDASCLDPVCIDPEACNYTATATGDYCLIVQPYQVHDGGELDGFVTYRIYIKTQSPDDFISSVSGDAESPTRIISSGSFFQSSFGGLLGSDQNPALWAFFPTAEYDSFVTVGLTQSPAAGEGTINVIESAGNTWGDNFENGQDLLIDDAIGGGWFIFNGNTNGIAGDDEQVLLAQVTTNGELSGSLYVQVFINGDPANDDRVLLDIEEACFAPGGPEVCEFPEEGYDCDGNCASDIDGDGICDPFEIGGCDDAQACNYDDNATDNDGSCDYGENGYDCEGNCISDADGDGICDEFEIAGCTDASACNYADNATDSDGSCTYGENGYDCDGNCISDADGDGICDQYEIEGCTDDAACNYTLEATDDDGSCDYSEDGYDCDDQCLNDSDGDGICDPFEIGGCDDAEACNYDGNSTDNDGSCDYGENGYDCDGNCLSDADSDGICDSFEVGGCNDANACNFDANATDNDGSCTYAEDGYDCQGNCETDADNDGICDVNEIAGCTVEYACNYNADATEADDTTCFYATAVFDCDGNCQQDENGNGVCDQLEGSCEAICGEGTIWDPESGTCVAFIDDCPYDLNGDGLVQLQDLMDFLLYYGTACPE